MKTLCILLLACSLPGLAQAPSPKLTPAFKAKAWRAFDALERANGPYSAEHRESNTDALVIDLTKAVDEAKYVAVSQHDKYVLRDLQQAMISFQGQLGIARSNPLWKSFSLREWQCQMEVQFYIDPAALSAAG